MTNEQIIDEFSTRTAEDRAVLMACFSAVNRVLARTVPTAMQPPSRQSIGRGLQKPEPLPSSEVRRQEAALDAADQEPQMATTQDIEQAMEPSQDGPLF